MSYSVRFKTKLAHDAKVLQLGCVSTPLTGRKKESLKPTTHRGGLNNVVCVQCERSGAQASNVVACTNRERTGGGMIDAVWSLVYTMRFETLSTRITLAFGWNTSTT